MSNLATVTPVVPVALIWAQSAGGVIGHNGTMPWHLPEDLAHFKELTLGNPVVMGRKTWDSLPARFRPLPGRRNIVVTRQKGWAAEGAEVAGSVAAAIHMAAESALNLDASSQQTADTVWVIGGAQIFEAMLGCAERLEITEIAETFVGDTVAPAVGTEWMLVASNPETGWHTSSTELHYRFLRYEKMRPQRDKLKG